MEVMANVLASGAFKQSQRWELRTENSGANLSTIIQSTTVLNKDLLDKWMNEVAITVDMWGNSPTELDTASVREMPENRFKNFLSVQVIRSRVMFG